MFAFFVRLAPLALVLALPLGAGAQTAAKMPSCAKGDPVVWVNTSSHVYHFKGDKYFGTTKSGQYLCQSKADASGAHAAKTASKGGAAGGAMSGDATSGMNMDASPAPAGKHKKKGAAAATPAP